jgi:hypothetical protein
MLTHFPCLRLPVPALKCMFPRTIAYHPGGPIHVRTPLWYVIVTRTSVPGVAPIHFPPRSRLLPIPGRLRAHTYAIPILADRTLPLPLLVVLSLITFPSPLYYICSSDPRLTPLCPFHSTGTNLITSRSPIPYCRFMTSSPLTLTASPVGDSAPVILTIVLVHDSLSPLPLPYHRYLTQFSFCLPFSVLLLTAWSVLSFLTYINPL